MRWHILPTLYWVGWILAFVVWETYAGVEKMGAKDVPMLTQATVRYVPGWIVMPFLTWLWIHFFTRYMNPGYVEWLRTGSR